jgi:hypothetical protein
MAPLEYFYSTPAPRAASRRLPGQTDDTAVLSARPVPASDFPRTMEQKVQQNNSTQHHRLVSAVLRGRAPLESDALLTNHSARPGVALALGGGFARGFAHLGVLQVLEENHIAISHIAGTSVGVFSVPLTPVARHSHKSWPLAARLNFATSRAGTFRVSAWPPIIASPI